MCYNLPIKVPRQMPVKRPALGTQRGQGSDIHLFMPLHSMDTNNVTETF
jgi:hypothetical protein